MNRLADKLYIFLVIMGLITLSGCQWVQHWWQGGEIEEVNPWAENLIAYEVVFAGEVPSDLERQLRRESYLVQRQEKQPVSSLIALRRRTTVDTENLKSFLKSQGYLDAVLKIDISQEPYIVTINVQAGERYCIHDVTLHNTRTDSGIQVSFPMIKSRVKIGDPLDTTKAMVLQKLLTLYLQEHGYPAAIVGEPVAEADRDQKAVHIHIYYNPGDYTHFGDHKILGLDNLAAPYIENRIGWKHGDPYDQKVVEDTERKLMDSGIFDSVHIQSENPQSTPTPMKIQVVEAKPRSVGAGIRYFSAEGLGVKAFWRHYNFLGNGELVNTSIKASPLITQGVFAFTIPDVWASEQQLTPSITATLERTKAYIARTLELGLKLERLLTENLSVSLALTLETGKIQRVTQKFREQLLGIPLEIKYDNTEDALNPESGLKAQWQIIPYSGNIGKECRMLLTRMLLSGYIPIGEGPDPFILALWTHLGNIFVRDTNNVPPNKRFYSGGGGSVRGYGFQRLGPLDENGVPLGGRSIAEMGMEGRFRFSETWGSVVFLEGGCVSRSRVPLTRGKLFWGAGAGLRYYTPLGPIRFDVAVPMSKRRIIGGRYVDNAYQFYISVGQAF